MITSRKWPATSSHKGSTPAIGGLHNEANKKILTRAITSLYDIILNLYIITYRNTKLQLYFDELLNNHPHNILWRLLTRTDIILSTEKLMLPIFWVDVGPELLEIETMHWCDSCRSAESRDLTADMCINAELSNSFTDQQH